MSLVRVWHDSNGIMHDCDGKWCMCEGWNKVQDAIEEELGMKLKIRTEDLENERYLNLNDLLVWINAADCEPEIVHKLKELNDVRLHPEYLAEESKCGAV